MNYVSLHEILDSTIQATETSVPLTAAQTVPVIAASHQRIALIFANPVPTVFKISTLSSIGTNQGIPVNTAVGPVILTYRDVGALVNAAWFAFISGAGGFCTVIECLNPELVQLLGRDHAENIQKHKRSHSGHSDIGYAPAFRKSASRWVDSLRRPFLPVHNRLQWQGSRAGPWVDDSAIDGTNSVRQRIRVIAEE